MKAPLFFLSLMLCKQIFCYSQSTIKVNQAGYLSGYPKYGWVNDPKVDVINWSVRRSVHDAVICSGIQKVSQKYDTASGERVTMIDFSIVDTPGTYYLEVENIGSSFEIKIAPDVYKEVWSDGIKSYYYQRSGIDLSPEYAGIWTRKASHLSDGII